LLLGLPPLRTAAGLPYSIPVTSTLTGGLRGTGINFTQPFFCLIENTFPVATPAIPQHPQWQHTHSPVSCSVTAAELHIGHLRWVVITHEDPAEWDLRRGPHENESH
jgi:hypothetical protein